MARWWRFFLRAGVGTAVAVVALLAPLPLFLPEWLHLVKAALTAFLLLVWLGTLLYDTLFYDQYRP